MGCMFYNMSISSHHIQLIIQYVVLFQLDVEMSFVTQDDIKNLIEALLKHCWPLHLEPLSLPLPRMSYAEAIRQYGTDKPDTRYDNLVMCRILLMYRSSL